MNGDPSALAPSIEKLAIDTIRTLSMDGVQRANSGHPGTPMALAPLAYSLWKNHLRFDPNRPEWPDRDRVVLSAGHASMLIYSILHLCGYDLDLDQLKNFRQWESRAPGHPERGETAGIEVTTGPLGQGIGNAVGLAIAERMLAARFNRPGHALFDHRTYFICGDGDLMEGLAYEATSIAGHQQLGKLIGFYDDNKISIAGSTDLTFTENVEARFQAIGWHTERVRDVNDLSALNEAIESAKAESDRPTLVLVRSEIGYGSPNRQGKKEAHGEPLGEEEVRLTKRAYEWPEDAQFLVPDPVREHFATGEVVGGRLRQDWESRVDAYERAFPELAKECKRILSGNMPKGWKRAFERFTPPDMPEATRVSSGTVIQHLSEDLGELVGGSADLDPSTKTFIKSSVNFDPAHPEGRNLQYGIREHAMGAIINGVAAHGGLRPFGSTFFVFSDYLRPAIRMAALSRLPSIFVFTHDSIAVGEDGPTHQPIEHLASLRAMPNVAVFRPADARETAEAWQTGIERTDGPSILVLSRQAVPQQNRDRGGAGADVGAGRGGYVLREVPSGDAHLTILATGSEVALASGAADVLEGLGVPTRVVSLPSWEKFEEQGRGYKAEVLGDEERIRLTIEAGSSFGWDRYANPRDAVVAIDRFGASAPGKVTLEKFGFTVASVVSKARTLLNEGNAWTPGED